MHLSDLGWSDHFESHFRPFRESGLAPARVGREQDKGFILYGASGEFPAQLSGKARDEGVRPVVGDWVAVHDGIVEAFLPRRTRFSRKTAGAVTEEQVVAANVDTAFLVSSLDREFKVRRIERYLTLVWEGGASPVILLNKEDVCEDVPARVEEAQTAALGVPVHPVSALLGTGLEDVRRYLAPGRTVAFLGSSGVGKSALVNALLGAQTQSTGPVREDDGRGRHTTTMRELFVLPQGGLVIDTPGMREVQLWADADDLRLTFHEIDEAARGCRFRDCSHEHEPGCRVQAGVASGDIAAKRFDSFLRLRCEVESLERRRARVPKERRRRTKQESWNDDD